MRPVSDVYTLPDLLVRAANRDPGGDCLVFPDSRVSFAEQYERAVLAARSLAGLGIGQGDHVGLLLPNSQEFVDLMIGAQLLGAWPVLINARFKTNELGYVIGNADLKLLVTSNRIVEHTDFVALLGKAFPDLAAQDDPRALSLSSAPLLQSIVLLGDGAPSGLMSTDAFLSAAERVGADVVVNGRARLAVREVCLMMYTSGTTAMPKGCPLTHEAVVRTALEVGRSRYALRSADRIWCPLPMFHVAFVLPFAACLDAGAALLAMQHFEPGLALDYMEREEATIAFSIFPAVSQAFVNHPRYRPERLKIRITQNIGPPDMLVNLQARMPNVAQISVYGLTECGGISALGHPDDTLEQRTRTGGRPLRGVEMQVRDPETDAVLGPGEAGELLVRGFGLFEGYYKDDAKNAACFTRDGWFRTGDICVLDDEGRVSFRDRAKDMLKVGGENVAAAEIESLLHQHPAVMLAQVVSAPDPKYLEVAAAYIQLVDGASATEQEMIEFCRGKIASFKVPRHVRFVTQWPMSATKIQKVRLRERIAAELAGGVPGEGG